MKRYSTQPQQAIRPLQYWIDKGLVYADNGGNLIWDKRNATHGRTGVNGGPKLTNGKYGKGVGYGTTVGTGTTDRTEGGSVIAATKYRSIVSFHYALSGGGGTFGRIFQKTGTSALDAQDESMYINTTTPLQLQYNRCANASTGTFQVNGSPVLNAWVCWGISYDLTSLTNVPVSYQNGILQTTVANALPVGTYTAGSYQVSRGNRSTDHTRNFDGILGPLYIFEGFLSQEDHTLLYNNPWALYGMKSGPSFDVPSGNTTTNQTITGVARIQATTTKTETGVARIQVTTTKTETGLARIQKVVNQTETGVARITASTSQTETGIARIQVTTTKTETGLARIQTVVNQTITGVANIVAATGTTNQTITGVARIQVTTTKTETGLARIQKSVDQTITGLSRIQTIATKTETGLARIQKVVNQTETGIARIQVTTNRTITGVARIVGAGSTTIMSSLAIELGGGVSKVLTPTGNVLEVEVLTSAPSGAPTNNKGVVFVVSGGVLTVYAWDGANWVS